MAAQVMTAMGLACAQRNCLPDEYRSARIKSPSRSFAPIRPALSSGSFVKELNQHLSSPPFLSAILSSLPLSLRCSWVELTFDDKPLSESEGKVSMGVRSAEWALLSGGAAEMPALLIDGIMYRESVLIVKMLATACPDESLSREQNAQAMRLIDLAAECEPRLSGALKHWGWSGMHENNPVMNSEHYSTFGMGKRDARWEHDTLQQVDGFFSQLEAALPLRPCGYFVAEKLTFADCALINFPLSFVTVVELDVERRYPKVCTPAPAIVSPSVHRRRAL